MDSNFNECIPQQPVAGNTDAEGYKLIPQGVNVSKGEYRRRYAPVKFYKDIRLMCIICYVIMGSSAALMILSNPFGLIDIALFLGLTLGLHLAKSKGCAIAMLAYGGISCLLNLVLSGTFSSWLWMIVGIWAIASINKVDKHYQEVTTQNQSVGY